jgi:hypothetical protein
MVLDQGIATFLKGSCGNDVPKIGHLVQSDTMTKLIDSRRVFIELSRSMSASTIWHQPRCIVPASAFELSSWRGGCCSGGSAGDG